MKKQISTILCLSLLAAALASCGSEGTEQPLTEEQTTVPAVTEETIPLTEADYAGTDIKILTAAEQWQDFYIADETGDAINDAVFERNRSVEERYNVNLDYQVLNGYMAGMESVRAALTGSVMAGSAEYDLMVGGISYITPYVMENLFKDLYTLDQLHLDQPWWFQHVNNEIDIGGHLYLGAGYYGMLAMANAIVTFFNKQVAEDYHLDDLYTLVDNGTWTFDKMMEIAQTVSADLNGDGKYDSNDRFGVMSTADYLIDLVPSMGYSYTERTTDGKIILREPTEQLINIVDNIATLAKDPIFLDGNNQKQLGKTTSSADEIYEELLNLFAGNQSLFLIHRLEFSTRETLRNMEKYGILPAPKYDEQQEDYITTIVNDVAAIPGVVKDTDMSAVLMEALQYYTYDIVRPQYYEIALKRKGTRDNASEKMLDLIFSNTVVDFVYIYLRIIGSELYEGATQKNYTSWAEKNYDKFRIKIDQMVETVGNFES